MGRGVIRVAEKAKEVPVEIGGVMEEAAALGVARGIIGAVKPARVVGKIRIIGNAQIIKMAGKMAVVAAGKEGDVDHVPMVAQNVFIHPAISWCILAALLAAIVVALASGLATTLSPTMVGGVKGS